MMLDSPHTSAPMLMRGNTPPTSRSHPTNHVQQDTRRRGRTGRERHDVEADVDRRGRPPSAGRHRPPTARHAPTPRTSSSHHEGRGPAPAQDRRAAPRGRRRAAPGTGPRRRPPRRRNPHATLPANHNRMAGKADAPPSATGPSTP